MCFRHRLIGALRCKPHMLLIHCPCAGGELWQSREKWIFSFWLSGAEDVVTAFSRSETEDRRQWPLPFSALAPSHRTQPCPRPITYVTHTARKLHTRDTDSGEGRHQAAVQERRGEAAAGTCLALSCPLNTPHHTIQLRCTQEPETLAWRKSVKTVTDFVTTINSYVFCLSGVFSLYYFCLYWDFGQCYLWYLLLKDWPVSSRRSKDK